MIKGIIFDFDGTLVDSNKIKVDTFYETTKDIIGAEFLLNKLLSSPKSGDRYNIFNTLSIELNTVNTDPYMLSKEYTEKCEFKISHAPEIYGATLTLQKLKNLDISTFISSATPEHTLKKIIKLRNWESLFDKIFGSPRSKLVHIQTILKENKFSKSEIIYVGDSEVDKNASSLVGCKFVGIGKDIKRFKSKPEFFFESLENLTLELDL
jgi:phosphoglycolate phosphatase